MIEQLFYSGKRSARSSFPIGPREPVEHVRHEVRIRDRVDARVVEVAGRVAH